MFAETTIKGQKEWMVASPSGQNRSDHITYIPSALLLLMAMDNGWNIERVKPLDEPQADRSTYLVTLRSRSEGKAQHLVIPKSALVDKILQLRAPATVWSC